MILCRQVLGKFIVFSPHPFIPAPSLVGGEEAEKQGVASVKCLGCPCFSDLVWRGSRPGKAMGIGGV
jgi:hypothetical protein